ncbi:hypothetical protein AAD018_013210 [Aestuariibius insulae]|uniref:hypothetical protein n=1 Tax=Aestuariibius insulae TaxID=2058287 RepID=UPI00345ED847
MWRFLLALALLTAGPIEAQTLSRQLAEARAAAAPYEEFRTARRTGWKPFGGDASLMGRHYFHPDNPDYTKGEQIDFLRPSNLVYSRVGGEPRLVALAYNMRIGPDEAIPEGFAGSQDIWHVHDAVKFLAAMREARPLIGGIAENWFQGNVLQKDGRGRLAMVHVWLIPNPKGTFASHNPALPYYDLRLPPEWASDGDMVAARGLALAQKDGCKNALDAELFIAGVDGRRKRQLFGICREGAARVKAELGSGEERLEAVARDAWQRLEDTRYLLLTAQEQSRIAAFVEDGPGICR